MFILSSRSCSQCSNVFNTALLRGETTGNSVTQTHSQQILWVGEPPATGPFKQMILNIQKGVVRTCKVKAGDGEEVLDVVMGQFHHRQADQSPAAYHTDRRAAGSIRDFPSVIGKKANEQRLSSTCRSWGRSAPSSACQRGRRRRRLRPPPRRFRPSHTEHCCPTAAGRAEIMRAERRHMENAGNSL